MKPRSTPVLALALALAGMMIPLTSESVAGDSPPDAPPEPVVIRPAAPPGALQVARVDRWRRAWRDEARGFERAFAGALRAAAGSDRELAAHCAPLAESILAIDRSRVLPVPHPAADLLVRRGLRAATMAAVSCLRGRPYAARGRLRAARADLLRARRLLRRFR